MVVLLGVGDPPEAAKVNFSLSSRLSSAEAGLAPNRALLSLLVTRSIEEKLQFVVFVPFELFSGRAKDIND